MIILPAIDIRSGKCVRLYQGDYNLCDIVAENPVETAKIFERDGAEYIHLVDLDGAKEGKPVSLEVVKNIIKNINVPVELGGGIRNMEGIEAALEAGASRVILGTAALLNEGFLNEAVLKYQDKIAVGIDARNGFAAVSGWIETSEVNYIDFAKKLEAIGVKTIIFTDISKDGTLNGPSLEAYLNLKNSVSSRIIASGGVGSINDIKALSDINIYGAVVGKAIYSKMIDLKEAIIAGRGEYDAL